MTPDGPDSPVALVEWAVTCDALARGEQILLLRADRLESDGDGPASLPREAFWLYPTLAGQSAREVADPYRDRIRALDRLERDDGTARLQYAATAEHVERIADRDRLMALDGQHTLGRSAVDRRLSSAGPRGLLFVVLRVYRRETALLVDEPDPGESGEPGAREGEARGEQTERAGSEPRAADGWIAVEAGEEATADRSRVEGSMEPVLSDERFLERKAELLQLSGSMQAM